MMRDRVGEVIEDSDSYTESESVDDYLSDNMEESGEESLIS